MISFEEINKTWTSALSVYSKTILIGERGPYRPISKKVLIFLDYLWKQPKILPNIGEMLENGKIVRFFGDPHLDHENILHLCNRIEFESIESMNATIWKNIEIAHDTSDLVVCVGDLSLKNPIMYQKRLDTLYGNKQLTLIGNHDIKGSTPILWHKFNAAASIAFTIPKELIISWFNNNEYVDVLDWSKLPKHINVGVSHWPVPPSFLPSSSWINVHGHIHDKPSRALRINCSVEAINYKPASFKDLLSIELIDDLIKRQSNVHCFDVEALTFDSN